MLERESRVAHEVNTYNCLELKFERMLLGRVVVDDDYSLYEERRVGEPRERGPEFEFEHSSDQI